MGMLWFGLGTEWLVVLFESIEVWIGFVLIAMSDSQGHDRFGGG